MDLSAIIGEKITYSELSPIDEFGYSADSILVHFESGSLLSIISCYENGRASLRVECGRDIKPPVGIYSRSARETLNEVIKSAEHIPSTDRDAIRIETEHRVIDVSVSNDDPYSLHFSVR